MSIKRLARHYGVAPGNLRGAILRGEIPHFRLGTMIRVYPANVPPHLVTKWARKSEGVDWPSGQLVYFLAHTPGFVKIGSTSDLRRRVAELQPGSPLPFRLLAWLPGGKFAEERAYHRRFSRHRGSGEWFTLSAEIEAEIARLNDPCLCGVAL